MAEPIARQQERALASPLSCGLDSSSSSIFGAALWASIDSIWYGAGIRLPRNCLGNANIASEVNIINVEIITKPGTQITCLINILEKSHSYLSFTRTVKSPQQCFCIVFGCVSIWIRGTQIFIWVKKAEIPIDMSKMQHALVSRIYK